jgi:hypothetical protein
MSGLRDELARRWNSLWRREHGQERGNPSGDRRRRFWSEFRDGQRQAEEMSSGNALGAAVERFDLPGPPPHR